MPMQDDQPQFRELSDVDLAKAKVDYQRIWGDAPDTEPDEPGPVATVERQAG